MMGMFHFMRYLYIYRQEGGRANCKSTDSNFTFRLYYWDDRREAECQMSNVVSYFLSYSNATVKLESNIYLAECNKNLDLLEGGLRELFPNLIRSRELRGKP